jgi:hypothetical protein
MFWLEGWSLFPSWRDGQKNNFWLQPFRTRIRDSKFTKLESPGNH